MTTRNISFTWSEFEALDDLQPQDQELVVAARRASESAYAPYSGFKVGAAVRLDNGIIVTGSNVENAAFPSGICAERNALSSSASNYPSVKPVAIAVAATGKKGLTADPVSPCGNCRQVIAEEEFRNNRSIRVILSGTKKIRIIEKGGDLLPLQFSRDDLMVTLP